MGRNQGFRSKRIASIVLAAGLLMIAVARGQDGPAATDAQNAGDSDAVVPVDLRQGITLAQQTATPMFVMLTRATCGNCNHLKGRLADDQELKDVLKSYVVVDVDVDGPVARQWQTRFPSPGQTLPFVYVVAATGQSIHSASGVQRGEELPNLLKQGLVQAEEIHQAAGLTRKKKKRRVAARSKPDATVAKSDTDGESEDEPAKARPAPKRAAVKVDPQKKAASSLKLARVFANKRPEKAIEYARKVIELAPGSRLADEAQELLESLK